MATGYNRFKVSVDVSEAVNTIHELYGNLNVEKFNECLEITVKDTGRRAVKKIIKEQIPQEYQVTPSWVGKKVLSPKFTGGGGRISCIVPIKGERGVLGGIFPASGGGVAAGRAKKNGAKLKKLKRKKSGVSARVLRAKQSTLPGELPNQGGNPPFRMPNGVVLTRSAKRHLVRVVGRGVPQMVDRHFEDKVEGPLNDYMMTRMDQVVRWKMKI